MTDSYIYTVALGIAFGILGGALAHMVWMVRIAHQRTEAGKTISLARKAVSLRIKALFLSLGIGFAAGLIVSLTCYDAHFPLWALIGAAFVGGFAMDLLVKTLAKVNVV